MNSKQAVIVIGAYGRLGSALCEVLLKQGYKVVGVGRKAERLAALPFAMHCRFVAVCCVVPHPQIAEAVLPHVQDAEIKAVVLCTGNHAAFDGYEASLQIVDANLGGVLNLYHVLLPRLQPKPLLVLCASLMATIPDGRYPAYAAAKAGVVQWVRSVVVQDAGARVWALLLGPMLEQAQTGHTTYERVAAAIATGIAAGKTGIRVYPVFYQPLLVLASVWPEAAAWLTHHFRKPYADSAI